MSYIKKSAATLFVGALLTVGAAAPAPAATQTQDGLVNVAIGDIAILNDARIGVVAQVVAQVCGLKVGPVAVLGKAVDRSGTADTVCTSGTMPVTISQN